MGVPLYKVAVLMGYQKAHVAGPRGQLISVALGSPMYPGQWIELKPGDGTGMYLHARTKKPMRWWVSEQWLAQGDLIRIETKVAEAGVGRDEKRSVEMVWSVESSAELVEVRWRGLGYKDWPLMVGRVREVSRTSPEIARDLSVAAVFHEGYDIVQDGTSPADQGGHG
jgi:hypothetical protein